MLLFLFSPATQLTILMIMVMPSIAAGIVGVLGALSTKLTDNLWLKILYGAIPAIIYLALTPLDFVLLVLAMYLLGLGAALLRWDF